jgi:hypothetical protein
MIWQDAWEDETKVVWVKCVEDTNILENWEIVEPPNSLIQGKGGILQQGTTMMEHL